MSLVKRKQRWILVVLLSLYSSASFAGVLANESNWFFGGGAGSTWANLSKGSTTVANGSDIDGNDLYSIHDPSPTATYSFDIGYRWSRPSRLFPHYSLAFNYTRLSNVTVNGTVDQYSLPDYVNYNYNLNVSSNVYSLVGKLDIYQMGSFSPYVSAGVGRAYNRTDSYGEQPFAGVIARVSPNYDSNTTSNTAFSAGAGVDYAFSRQLWMSLGYEYSYLGKVKTGNGEQTWSGESLSLGNLTSNAVALKVYYQLPFA